MRRMTWGAAALATTAALSVAVNGLAGSTGSTANPFTLPTAAADELPAFTSCDELRDWYVHKAIREVGPYGFGYPYPVDDLVFKDARTAMEATVPTAPSSGPEDEAGSSDTGTNVQETGVDEPDVAKTNGDLVVQVRDDRLLVTDVSSGEPERLGTLPLPGRMYGAELLLVGDTVLVTGTSAATIYRGKVPSWGGWDGGGNGRLVAVSIADPAHPTVTSDQKLQGTIVSARQYGDTVRVALRTGYPDLVFEQPRGPRDEHRARTMNRSILRASTIDDWLPSVTVGGKTSPLVSCEDVRHPRTDSGLGTITILTFDAATPTDRSATAVTTSGDLVYSSEDRMYVATPVDRSVDGPLWRRGRPPERAKTEIHAFALEGATTEYVASGTVPGVVRDRWSLDEYDGSLRVATALTRNWQTVENGLAVLREEGSALRLVGEVGGMGVGEEIQSVRWFDDLAIVVTFRQMDPLYTVDLSDPENPRVLGALKIPGFSSYLHPIGADRLLGLGTAATKEGQALGAQISTFDISDLREPEQLSVVRFAKDESLEAAWDPRAFSYLPASGDVFTTVSDWDGHVRVIRLAVGAEGTLRQVGSWPSGYDVRTLRVDDDRVALVGDEIRLVRL